MQTVIIIHEFNCYESTPSLIDRARLGMRLASSVSCRSRSTVWLALCSFDLAREDHTKVATRINGPIPTEQAESVIRQLEVAFRSAGFEVLSEVMADD